MRATSQYRAARPARRFESGAVLRAARERTAGEAYGMRARRMRRHLPSDSGQRPRHEPAAKVLDV
jgi:hypothetical protein